MALTQNILSPGSVLAGLAILVAFHYAYSHFVTYSHLRHLPGPSVARLSNLWLFVACRRGKRYQLVDEAHENGTVQRIAPNHISIADEGAVNIIYGHGNGFLKPDFYDAFVSIRRGLFNTRNRAEHTRKRKLVSHTFSAKSVGEFETYIRDTLRLFVKQLDLLTDQHQNESGKRACSLDILPWFNYLAFDAIGELAFGSPFGMLRQGEDVTQVRRSPDSPPQYVSAIEALNRRGEVSATLGCMPWLIPYARWIPDSFFSRGLDAVTHVAGIAIARVKDRIENPPNVERKDLLARLMEGRDENGEPLGREELTAEALTHVIAGSDTTSNSSCALMYYLARNSAALSKLQQELDKVIPEGVEVPTYEMVREVDYLDWAINEALRLHSTSGIGLPREVPPGSPGVTILGQYYPPGTILSVPTYTIHHSKEIWGEDADDFKPERWEVATPRQKTAFIPFSHGPRSCVGRNVAELEMKLIAATWVRRYCVELEQGVLQTREGFLRKPLELHVALSRR
ncbi:Benzoate 4-monooxygenase [Hirsutella minnesotensis 3608]|nr:Benzoate 4-monooxygenase [Hirsutella minnesotensis 3608]